MAAAAVVAATVAVAARSAFAETPSPLRSGYTKAYRYDDRLRRELPPYFPYGRVTDYLLFTNFEILDPEGQPTEAGCAGRYRSEWEGAHRCVPIYFTGGDHVEGPFHTNDSTAVVGDPEFGRAGANPPDVVEMVGGIAGEGQGGRCASPAVFHTATGCYVRGERIPLPESVTGLAGAAEAAGSFSGETRLELDGNTNTIRATGFAPDGAEQPARTIPWPANGLIYVRAASCGWRSTMATDNDGPSEARSEKGCGNVYVRGTYSRSLTIVAEEDLIIDGSVYPTSVNGHLGAAPAGDATLGLVAGDHVRIYHPTPAGQGCSSENLGAAADPNDWGAQPDIWIYAAILAVSHSFFVDDAQCGAPLGALNIYGSLAENYHGIVGTVGGGTAGTSTPPPPASCTSRRRFLVHVAQIPGVTYRRVKVLLNGRRIATRLVKHRVTAEVDLRGRPKGTYVLRIVVETRRGREISATRTYHTCSASAVHPRRPALL